MRLIILNEICERFSYYGFRAILSLYLSEVLDFSEDQSIAIYSYFSALAYCTPLIGGHISDAYWGRYKTIVVFSCVYLVGSCVLSGGAWSFLNPDNLAWPMFVAMALTSIGTGGIKPCVSTFGADQLGQLHTPTSFNTESLNNSSINRNSNVTTDSLKALTSEADLDVDMSSIRRYDSVSRSTINVFHSSQNPSPTSSNSENAGGMASSASFDSIDSADIDITSSFLSRRLNSPSHFSAPPLQSSSFTSGASAALLDTEAETLAASLREEHQKQELRTQSFFYMFYFSMNIGSVFSLLIIPLVRTKVSYAAAFALPAFFLFISVVILLVGNARGLFVKVPPSTSPLMQLLRVLRAAYKNRFMYRQIQQERGSGNNESVLGNEEYDPNHNIQSSSGISLDYLENNMSYEEDAEHAQIIARETADGPSPIGRVRSASDRAGDKIQIAEAIEHRARYAGFMDWLDAAALSISSSSEPEFSAKEIRDSRRLLSIVPVFSTLPFFWCLMNQQGSTWVYQAKDMNLTVFSGFTIEPEQLQVINPIVLFIFLPLFEWIFRSATNAINAANVRSQSEAGEGEREREEESSAQEGNAEVGCLGRFFALSTLGKLGLGMFVASMAYVCATIVDLRVHNAPPKSVSILFQVPQYILVTAAEVLVSVTGLHFAFEKAPSNMKSLVTALLMFSSAVGDLITSIFYNIFASLGLERYEMFIVFAIGMIINLGYFLIIKAKYGHLFE